MQAEQDGFDSNDIFFQPAESFSPYYEHSFKNINQSHVDNPTVEINPLYRFSTLFEYLLHPDVQNLIFAEQKNLIRYYFDLVMHILVEIDLCHGMTRREFYVRKIRREMLDGVFGETVQIGMNQMKKDKQLAVAESLLCVMGSGSSVYHFCQIMKQIFPGCIVYQSRAHPQRLFVYIGRERDDSLQKQWRMIRETFLPIDIEVREFWSKHFGIIDVDETMIVDAIAIF